ncbi:protein phosphatase 1 regulatory inhibitor subunit PPP1R8 homolog [Malania oleifera]|uniref:protein phosphatase 1 regulatory inhibitor subunit PPP1R8 homolog n=1 Tax=Malania oleifera TaxID=397392 RepID=UPI0025AE6F4B|nr:protein phosphatase 1 regulatory inhibitor subunit PPP1R8 homolog [Malania oleifera]XP_057982912.1 protein phosphatase 1 regulatory inhibitor subunit PPP1R8 homolog [Malania oleifera]XP_057982923.1 protein phosphatase 1 regulatory inhibitor subunit PPP1R8 homolog [Malania oleifera]XP_057982933.1 protein phosphatase 1 regulatory inhibitor subunit PPP1R8 homolog [Malania oleifera]XP_057982939.1 protein phosphatase 1 regulatory inhibitor subunit PPP1R8 homolog [Malania oleifera]
MYGRIGLERFKKAQSLEPFSVNLNSSSKVASLDPQTSNLQIQSPHQHHVLRNSVGQEVAPPVGLGPQVTQVGGGQSTWRPPDWAIEPRLAVYYLEVLKDGEILGRINLDKRRHVFGRQFSTCDFVLDHQSISRQHAAVVPHKNGSIYVIDLGSVHGTFVANERLARDNPVELEVGQSLRFAASTRSYILRKNIEALFPHGRTSTVMNLPPHLDPSDEDGVLAYNTLLNRYGMSKSESLSKSFNELESSVDGSNIDSRRSESAAKRIRKTRVAFRDQVGGDLSEVVGISDGVDVETEPGPVGVKEGSLVGKYESLVQITVIPKGKEQSSSKEDSVAQKGVTDKLKEVLNKVKSVSKSNDPNGIYDDLYGEAFLGKVGSSWAFSSAGSGDGETAQKKDTEGDLPYDITGKPDPNNEGNDDKDDLFGV